MPIYPATITPRGLRVADSPRVPEEFRERLIEWNQLSPRFRMLDDQGRPMTTGCGVFRTYLALRVVPSKLTKLARRMLLHAAYRVDPVGVESSKRAAVRTGWRVIALVVLAWHVIPGAILIDILSQGHTPTFGMVIGAIGASTLACSLWMFAGIRVVQLAWRDLAMIRRWGCSSQRPRTPGTLPP